MLATPDLNIPPAIVLPDNPAPVELVKRRKTSRTRAITATIGAIIILSDGTRCQIAGYDREGRPLCYPVEE
jgi:hypothetical protein